ncbi:SH3 and PX domain-containing protein 2A-like isoform X2 [Corticium candelabrum]|nr:SH3 and PX domain-containing protein 2A-like isoform X2 [Corticium candelabrum]XP_062511003.1 SH3 and PX domain-containing protein 2A-like isoform X2 [Corticium candelabrum]XP_062511010.1 SH3 and PX domain-containing protein 2A-like isoform X2 [Corticium candelabrum]
MIAMASRVKSSAMLKKTNSQPSLLFYAIADFEPNDSMIGALRLERGDEVEVLKRDPSGWWCVSVQEKTGWAPSTFLSIYRNTVMGGDTGATAMGIVDKSQPFRDNEHEENGYLTLHRRRNAPFLSEEGSNVSLSANEREDDVEDVDEAEDEDPYVDLEGTDMCVVNRAGIAVDDEGYVKIAAVPLPLPAVSSGSCPQRITSTGSSIDSSESCRSPSPTNSSIGDNSPFPPSPKREVQSNCPAIPPRRLPRQPVPKRRPTEQLFTVGSVQLKGGLGIRCQTVDKRSTEEHKSSPKFVRSLTDSQLLNSSSPANAMSRHMIEEVLPEDEPFCLPQREPPRQIQSSQNDRRIQWTAQSRAPRKPRRCLSDDTVRLAAPDISPEVDHHRSSMPSSRIVGSYAATIGNMPWFHGRLSRQKAENRLLKGNVNVGDFLVRESESQPGNYTMSVRSITSEALHFKITVLNGGEKFAMENTLFSSIEKIVEFYQTHDIFETEGQRLKLNKPVKKREAVG